MSNVYSRVYCSGAGKIGVVRRISVSVREEEVMENREFGGMYQYLILVRFKTFFFLLRGVRQYAVYELS